MGLASNKAVQKSGASGNPWLKRRSVCLSWDTYGGSEKVDSEVSFGASGADLLARGCGPYQIGLWPAPVLHSVLLTLEHEVSLEYCVFCSSGKSW